MHSNKKVGRGGRSNPPTESQEQEWNFRTIRKEVENFGSLCLTWKEKKDLENKKMVELGGKAPKKQRLPLSVARPVMKNQKQREEKLAKERLALGRFGMLLGGSASSKPQIDKRKPIVTGLKPSEGTFVNGCLHVDRLLKTASRNEAASRKEADSSRPVPMKGKTKGGKKNQKNKKNKGNKGGRGKRH